MIGDLFDRLMLVEDTPGDAAYILALLTPICAAGGEVLRVERLSAATQAHEINNPLAAVVAGVEFTAAELKNLAARSPVPREVLDAVDDTRDAIERIRTIARDLRVFSRAEEDKRDAVNVERLLESTLRMAWNEIRHRARIIKDYARVPCVDANGGRLGHARFACGLDERANSAPAGAAPREFAAARLRCPAARLPT